MTDQGPPSDAQAAQFAALLAEVRAAAAKLEAGQTRDLGHWPKLLMGAAVTVCVGGIGQGIALYTQAQVTLERVTRTQEDVAKTQSDVAELRAATSAAVGNRWRREDHETYAEEVDRRVRELAAKIEAATREQVRLSAERESVRAAIETLRSALREHSASGGHAVATERLRALEARLRKLEEDNDK